MQNTIWVIAGLVALGVIFWLLAPYFGGVKILSAVWFSWGSLQLRWYGIFLALGVVLGLIWWNYLTRGAKWRSHLFDMAIFTVLGGIVGARLLFVILKWPDFIGREWEIFNLAGGGLSIHGALGGGVMAIWGYCKKWRLPVAEILDSLAPVVVLGQMIGRWGNFFNQEAFGGPTDLPWKMFVSPEFRPKGFTDFNFFHPTFLYEILGLGIILAILLWLRQRRLVDGAVTLIYLLTYALLRFGIEFYRVDSDYWGVLTIAQWGSLLIMAGAVIGLILMYRSKSNPSLSSRLR